MSIIKKLAGETVIYGMGSVLPRFLNFIVLTPFLTRELSEDLYGVYGILYAISAFMLLFLSLRMETTFFRFGSEEGQLNRVFSTACIALIGSAFIGISSLTLFSDWLAQNFVVTVSNSPYIKLIAIIVLLDLLTIIPFARLRLENRPYRFAAIKIINVGVMIALLFFLFKGLPFFAESGMAWANDFYHEEDKLTYALWANIGGSSVMFVLLLPGLAKIKWQFDTALFKKMFWYALPLIGVGVAGWINNFSDRILIGILAVGDEVERARTSGIFNACIKIAVLMQLFITAFNYAAEPFFFKQAKEQESRLIYAQVAQLFTIVGCVAFLGILLYLDIAKHIIDEPYHEGLVIVPIVLLAYLFQGLFYNFSIWYKITDKTWIGGIIAGLGSIVVLGINFILIPKIGYLAAAWSQLACFAFMAMASYWVGRRYYPIPYPIGKMLVYIILALGVYGVSEWLRPMFDHSFFILLLVNTALLLAYLIVLWIWEGKSIQQMIKGN